MKHLIDTYLEFHETAWAPTSYKSEAARLRAISADLDSSPEALHAKLQLTHKPYSVKTIFIRVCALERWAYDQGHVKTKPFQDFMRKHRNRFKHAYVREEITIGYEDARRRLESISSEPARSAASALLRTGLRITELYTQCGGSVVGKGGKTRKVFGSGVEGDTPKIGMRELRKALADVGLKPHTLRKLAATRAAERGATAADLCKIFGWSNIQTAIVYLQARNDEKLAELMSADI